METQEVHSAFARVSVAGSALRPRLSICIVNWNCREYLRQLLASIEGACEDVACEIIVVDNASTDDSAGMVEDNFPQVRLIRNSVHQGVARANNRAAARASGDLLLFLNNDTVLLPGSISRMVLFLDDHPDVVLAGPRLILPDGKTQPCVRTTLTFRALLHRIWFLRWTGIFRSAHRRYQQVDFDLAGNSYVRQIVGAALLMRRQQFFEVGGWDETFEFRMDDVDLSLRLSQVGKVYYCAQAQVTHWGGVATELDRSYAYWKGECSTIHYIRKHFGGAAALGYKMLVLADIPVRIVVLGLSWLAKKMAGGPARAARSHRKLAAVWHFLARELPSFLGS